MKPYALGIIAVLFLSVGYSAYRNAEASRSEALAVAGEVRTFPSRVPLPAIEPDAEEAADPDAAEEFANVDAVAAANDRAVRPVRAGLSRTFAPTRRVAQVPKKRNPTPAFTDTVIYYKEPDRSLLADARPTSGVLGRREERRKNRSLLSKTFSVVKKPYDWLKAVASKID